MGKTGFLVSEVGFGAWAIGADWGDVAESDARWVLTFPEVSDVTPGAKNQDQARSNAVSSNLPPISDRDLDRVRDVYERLIAPHVHHRW